MIKFIQAFFLSLLWLISIADAQVSDAHFVSFTAPDTVETEKTFEVRIVMQNVGTGTWEGGQTPITMVAVDPTYNWRWNLWWIIMPQDSGPVSPGSTFTFWARFQAPSTPGTYTSYWRPQSWLGNLDTAGVPFFGDTAKKTIVVIANDSIDIWHFQPVPSNCIDSSDIECLGAFRLPDFPYRDIQSGITLKKDGATKTLLIQSNNNAVYEVSIPEPITPSSNTFDNCNVADSIHYWGGITATIGGEQVGPNSGIYYDTVTRILYYSHVNLYYTGNQNGFPMINAVRLNANHTIDVLHRWYINSGVFKSFWGYITALPTSFANTYTGGRELLASGGGAYSMIQTSSRGTGFGAIEKYVADTGTYTNLFSIYVPTEESPEIRDGNYANQIDYYYWPLPLDKNRGYWTGRDEVRASVVVDLPDKKGLITMTQQEFGKVTYEWGGYQIDEHMKEVWYFYNIDTLGKACTGGFGGDSIPISSIRHMNRDFNGVEDLGKNAGICIDPDTRRLYVVVVEGSAPWYNRVVYVYHIKSGSTPRHNKKAKITISRP